MSLLTVFGLMFETDADDAAKSVGGLDDKLKKTEGSAKSATTQTDAFTKTTATLSKTGSELVGTLTGMAAAYLSVSGAISSTMTNAALVDDIGKFSQTLGFNASEVDTWGQAIARNGGSAEGFRSTLGGLKSQLDQLALTGSGDIALNLSRVGVSAFDSSGIRSEFDILRDLSDQMQGMAAGQSSAFGQMLGLDQGTILTLQQGRYELDTLLESQREFAEVNNASYEASANFNDSIDNTKRSMLGLWLTSSTTVLPAITGISDAIGTTAMWIDENGDLMQGAFVGLAGVLTAVYLPAIASVATATAVAIAPFVAIGAAVAAFAVAWDDVSKYMSGQESLIGRIGEKYEWFGKILDGIKGTLQWMSENTLGDALGKAGIWIKEALGIQYDPAIITGAKNTAENPFLSGAAFSSPTAAAASKTNNITVTANVNAAGMSRPDAQALISESLIDQIGMAIAELDSGVD